MKIENNGISPVSPKKVDSVSSAAKKAPAQRASGAAGSKDRAEVTENARLLAKARVSLDSLEEVENARVEMLRSEIQNGTYQIPVEDLAKRLLAKPMFARSDGEG